MGLITIDFQNAAAPTVQIVIFNGSFALDPGWPLSVSGTTGFVSLSATAESVSFDVPSGSDFQGRLTVPISAPAGAPMLVVNFSGTASVTWPSTSGTQLQVVTPGQALPLEDFAS
jgi:hypothetical protein